MLAQSISIKAVAMRCGLGDSGLFGFWLRFGSVTGLFQTCSFAEASPKAKILAAHPLHLFVNVTLARRCAK